MQVREIRQQSDEDIKVRLEESRRELFNLRQDWYLGSLQDHNRITEVKRDIARMKTVLRERELAMLIEREGGS